jgi:hypothetical protein
MRAGLLSQPQVIRRINQHFVCATLSYFELVELRDSGNALAREVLLHWRTPLALVFLTPDGRFVSKLSSLEELNEVHPDTSRRPEAPQFASANSDVDNARVFLKHLDEHFPDQVHP